MDDTTTAHVPVLAREVLTMLDVRPGSVVVDATLGAGGHAQEILEYSAPDGRLIGLDADCVLLERTKRYLRERFGRRVSVRCDFFDNLREVVGEPVDGVLFDLGISSWHLERSWRGFSFQRDELLDMRLNPAVTDVTAADIVNHEDVEAIERLLRQYGDERFAGRIARSVVRNRPVRTSAELARIIGSAVPRRSRLHPATRTFQALRIAVNDELGRLERALPQAVAALKPGGRCVVIAFHSLEDRIVKQTFRDFVQHGRAALITKKPITPSREEIQRNSRARSAKLRGIIKEQ